jgi:hypothetical protein
MDHPDGEGGGQEAPEGGEPGGLRPLSRPLPVFQRQGPEEWGERPAQHHERRGDQDQHLVLGHVGREQDVPQGVERRDEGGGEGEPARREARRLPAADTLIHPCPLPEPADAAGVEPSGEGEGTRTRGSHGQPTTSGAASWPRVLPVENVQATLRFLTLSRVIWLSLE